MIFNLLDICTNLLHMWKGFVKDFRVSSSLSSSDRCESEVRTSGVQCDRVIRICDSEVGTIWRNLRHCGHHCPHSGPRGNWYRIITSHIHLSFLMHILCTSCQSHLGQLLFSSEQKSCPACSCFFAFALPKKTSQNYNIARGV